MTQRLAVSLLVLTWALPLSGEERGFKKPYFGATKPGTFARQKATDETGAVSQYTYSRLADVAGEPVVESSYEALTGQFKGSRSVTGCLLPASFSVENDVIDFQSHARRCLGGTDGAHSTEYPAAAMKAISEGASNYAPMVTFKGTETVDGKPADRYAYQYKSSYKNIPATSSGDIWLSDAVPFGLVKEVLTLKDASGKTLSRIETVLVESGDGAKTVFPGWSWSGPAKKKAAPAARKRH